MSPPGFPAVSALATYTEMRDMACDGMTDAQCAYYTSTPWRNWYVADLYFGQATIAFFCAAIGFFAVLNVLHRGRQSRINALVVLYLPGYTYFAALFRSVAYRRFRLRPKSGYSLTLGETIIVCSMIIFFSAMALGPKPYYWPKDLFQDAMSPPMATRCGWMAIAILPFQVLLATKWNFITVLTGVSHEKLQVYHRWSGWIMYVLALMHTFPFIIQDIQTGTMEEEWATDWFVWSGVLALVPQTFLVTASIGCIRNRFYETFKSLHLVMAAFFIVALVLHCDFILTAGWYFVGFGVTYVVSWLFRWAIAFKNGFGHRADIEVLDDRMLRLTIPTKLKWKPGQHYFVRFLTKDIHAFTSHPFTVATVPSKAGVSSMEIYMRMHGGMTAKLGRRDGSVGVLLDGPYGGLTGDIATFDRVLLVAGGSGGSFILSVLQHLAQQGKTSTCQAVTVVYSCRTPESATWFSSAFTELANSTDLPITLFFHVSSLAQGVSTPALSSTSSKGEKTSFSSTLPVLHGRPNVPAHIRELTDLFGTLGVVVCGPKELDYDVRNTIAAEQLKIAKGTVGCEECYLHSEAFGW
ncbi:hypothetical protein MNV49_001466 [Pseudohyphozyma bogoriensis]|nr:hypothetical protein MNV49_001466 [Pseudohyphozyma bogoriensis]